MLLGRSMRGARPPKKGHNLFGEDGRPGLSELLAQALLARAAVVGSGGDEKARGSERKRRKKDLVQSTLNLSRNPGPRFTICKSCGLLYNHLNGDDRKTHARQHAISARAKPGLDQDLAV